LLFLPFVFYCLIHHLIRNAFARLNSFTAGLQILVARSREDYCSLLLHLARNSEILESKRTSSAAAARQKLLLTQNSHAVWDVEAQANAFQVRPACARRMNSK
jgi:hypothetical protein